MWKVEGLSFNKEKVLFFSNCPTYRTRNWWKEGRESGDEGSYGDGGVGVTGSGRYEVVGQVTGYRMTFSRKLSDVIRGSSR